ncbi:MAG: cysteine desulfurase [Bdellovibrionaceae bacterium]|nr:cysteine desulfurase [Pseudobdellovibrionaceae bacterium]
MTSPSIYLDYNSSTPVDPKVLDSMLSFLKDDFGNPSSQGHPWGWAADKAVNIARTQVASLLGCDNKEITFTSGATESNNWALFGLIHHIQRKSPGQKIHIISSQVEHNSILNGLKYAQELGIEVDFLPVNKDGVIDPAELQLKIKPHTRLISIMWVNNEIGSINDVVAIGTLARSEKIYFHTDGTQAVGKLPMNLRELPIDILSFSGHKIYGPKGVGVLYKRRKDPFVDIDPLFLGGGQEGGQRSGTLNVPGIVGIGKACEIISQHFGEEMKHYRNLLNQLLAGLKAVYPDIKLNGPADLEQRSPINLSITFPERLGADLSLRIPGVGVSTGSACSTGKISASHVLKGIGLTPEESARTLRLSVGRYTTSDDIKTTIERFKSIRPIT